MATNYRYQKDKIFTNLISYVITSEGGYVNDPDDAGGPTKYGVAYNFNAEYLKKHYGMKNPTDIKNLTLDQARQLYYDKYWIPSGANGITDNDLAYIHLDAAINHGTTAAAEFLRKLSVNPKWYDGSGGKNRTLFMSLFLEYTAQRLMAYTTYRDRDVFLAGWVRRISDVITNSLNLE